MTAPAGFEPTLDIPLTWIEELTGTPRGGEEPLPLSYSSWLNERVAG